MKPTLPSDYTAVLLAAGYGSRINSVTQEPKCLLPLGKRTLLERHFEVWKTLGIKKVNLVLGYKAEVIQNVALRHVNDFQFQFPLNADYRTMGNTFSLLKGIELAQGPVLIFDADLVYETDILKDILDDAAPDQILVGKGSMDDIECSKALVDQAGWVRKTVDKRAITPEELAEFKFVGEAMGILKFSTQTTQALCAEARRFLANPKNSGLNWEHLLNVFLPKAKVGMHMNTRGKWIEIDTPEDYERGQALFP